jgi:hypothetical protein
MSISDVRRNLNAIKASAEAGQLDQVVERVNDALQALDDQRLLTTTEAAALLGIRSVNTLKLLVRRLGISYVRHGNRMMLALDDVERVQRDQVVAGVRASDSAHDEMEALGAAGGLTSEQMYTLEAGRPSHLPWQRHDPAHV